MVTVSRLAFRSTWSDDSMQSVLNAAARLTYHLRRSDHIACLHWLCVPDRIEFKIALLTYKVVHGLAQGYLGLFTRVADLPSRR